VAQKNQPGLDQAGLLILDRAELEFSCPSVWIFMAARIAVGMFRLRRSSLRGASASLNMTNGRF
jgi:hypothetical protein